MPELLVINGIRSGTLLTLREMPAAVGRVPECTVHLGDPWVSSRHARFERRGDRYWIVDLQSSNGTFVEGARVHEAPLEPGARIRFGRTETEFRDVPVAAAPPVDVLRQQGTFIRSLSDLQAEVAAAKASYLGKKTLGAASGAAVKADPALLARRQVAVLNEIGKSLIEAANLDSSLSAILSTTAEAVRAERSCLLLMDESGRLTPKAYAPAGVPPRLSGTVVSAAIQTALDKKAGILILDAQADERFAQSRSILSEGIRSCMCVPVWGDNRILGMLVLDRSFADPFTPEDLELVTVVGYQAALAIERARFLARAQEGEAQRKKLLRHFSPDVANMVLHQEQLDRDPLEVSLRDEVTVLFSDVQGFTGLTERLPPLELGALLKDYFREMTEAIFEQGGTLDKFIGDGLMAVFGAPVAQAEGPEKALRCALRMLERLEVLNRRLGDDRKIAIRIGVNTGRVIAGNFGSPERLEFTVLGDTVNTASRLESIASAGAIYVGRSTYERTRGLFVFRDLGPQALKGKKTQVDVFELVRAT